MLCTKFEKFVLCEPVIGTIGKTLVIESVAGTEPRTLVSVIKLSVFVKSCPWTIQISKASKFQAKDIARVKKTIVKTTG